MATKLFHANFHEGVTTYMEAHALQSLLVEMKDMQWCWQRLKRRIIYGRRIYSNYYYRSSSFAGIHKRCQPSDVLYWPFYRSFVTCRHAPATAAAITSLRIFFKGDMIPMITAKLIPQLWLMTTRWISHLHFPNGSHRIGNWMVKGIFIGCLPLSVNQRTAAAAGGVAR